MEDDNMDIEQNVARLIKVMMDANKRTGEPLYSFRRIPCGIDALISDFVRMFMLAVPCERQRICAAVPPMEGALFYCFAGRMATLGVRERSRQRLLEGLVALIIEGYKQDFRDNIIRLGPLHDAAMRIDTNPRELFDEAAAYFSNAAATDIVGFPRRAPENRSLEAMGFKESYDADGFKYERTY